MITGPDGGTELQVMRLQGITKYRRKAESLFIYMFLAFAGLAFLFPVYWLVLSSFKPVVDMFRIPPYWTVRSIHVQNYREAFVVRPFFRYMLNSGVVATCSTAISTTVGALAAYGIAKYRFRGSERLFLAILALRMVPVISVTIPFFLILMRVHLIDTLAGLILVYVPFQIPLAVWLMHSFFSEVPEELEDAAKVDGCSRVGAFLRIALPIGMPGMAVTAIFIFISAWNEFFLALIMTSEAAKTMPVGLAGLITGWEVIWGPLFAGSVVYILPLLLLSSFLQRYVARGFLGGGVKG